jgi:putative oxidoreductase
VNGKRTIWTEQIAVNLLRIVTGFLFWQHGTQKLFGFPGGEPVGDFFGMMGLAGLLEVVGGTLLVLGLFTRPVAFILAGEMAWAYFQVSAPEGFWPILNGGENAAFYSFLFLYVAARGGGVFSLDGLRQLRREAKPKKVAAAPEAAAPLAAPLKDDDFPELTEEDLAEDPEIAELLGDNP